MLGSAEKRWLVRHGTGVSLVISRYGLLQIGHLYMKWWLTVQTEPLFLSVWLFTRIIGGFVSSFLPLPFSKIVWAFTIACFCCPGQWIRRCGQVSRQPLITKTYQLAVPLKYHVSPWILDPNYDVMPFVDSFWENHQNFTVHWQQDGSQYYCDHSGKERVCVLWDSRGVCIAFKVEIKEMFFYFSTLDAFRAIL